MDLCNESCLSGLSFLLRSKHFNVGHCRQTFQPFLFILAMLIGTVEMYHFIPLSLILALAVIHKVRAKQKHFASFSLTLLR